MLWPIVVSVFVASLCVDVDEFSGLIKLMAMFFTLAQVLVLASGGFGFE